MAEPRFATEFAAWFATTFAAGSLQGSLLVRHWLLEENGQPDVILPPLTLPPVLLDALRARGARAGARLPAQRLG